MKHLVITIAAVVLVGAKTVGSDLVLTKVKYEQGEKIKISFSGGPNNAEDWVGIYKEEQLPGDVDSTDWLYVNGTQEATTGKSSGQLVFDLPVGKYEAFFLENGGNKILASASFSIGTEEQIKTAVSSEKGQTEAAEKLPKKILYLAKIYTYLRCFCCNSS